MPRERSVQFSIKGQLLRRNVKLFRGGLVFKAHRLLHHSTLGSRGMKEKKKNDRCHRCLECCRTPAVERIEVPRLSGDLHRPGSHPKYRWHIVVSPDVDGISTGLDVPGSGPLLRGRCRANIVHI